MLKRRVALITSLAAKMQYEAIKEAGTYGGGLADFIEENYPRFSVSNRTDTRATFRNGRITETPAEMSNEEKEEAWAEYQERNRPQTTDEERYREESGRGLLFNKSKNLTTRADGYPIADDNETVDVVEIPENAIPDFKTRADLRNWLIGKFEEIGHTTIQSTGANVDFNKTAAQRVVKNSRQRRNNMAYPEIEKVVSGAKYSGFRLADERHKEKVRGQDVYHSGITYKGIPYSVEFYVDVPLNIEATDNFAGNKIRQIRIAPTETLLTSDRQNRAANNPSDAIRNISLAVLRGKVNPARQENGLLFSKAETVRGTYNPERRLIELFADRKPETVLHEVSHYFFQNYFAVADKYGYSDYDRGMLRWLSKQGKHEIKSLNDMETQDWENLTETFLRYLNTGNAPTIATRGVFQKAKEWVLDVFEINRDIASNEVKDFFDSLVAREGKMPNIDELFKTTSDINEALRRAKNGESATFRGVVFHNQ